MTTDLQQACTDLAAWHTTISHLIAEPDTIPTIGHNQPGSRPPWNSAVANAKTDVHSAARAIEADLRYAVTGRYTIRGGSDGNTMVALDAIPRLAEAAPDAMVEAALFELDRLLSAILQLPAIDLEQPPQTLAARCPRPGCGRPMLRWYPLRRELACLGCMVKGVVYELSIKWEDGCVT